MCGTVHTGEFIGKAIPEEPMCLASIRMHLTGCDETLGPVLTIVGESCLYAIAEPPLFFRMGRS